MSINLQQLYAGEPQAAALDKTLTDAAIRRIFLQGMVASAAPVFFSGMANGAHKQLFSCYKMPTKQDISTKIWCN